MENKQPVIAPSILAADYSQLGSQIEECNKADAQWIHCDIMDGHFVPNISYGPTVVQAAAKSTDAFIDVHLMIENPDAFIETFAEAGAGQITVHQEACIHLHRTIQSIRHHGLAAGVAVNPATSLQTIEPIINNVDLVLLMSVNPGFGGQSFIRTTYQRLQRLCTMRDEHQADFFIEVDGGINLDNIEKISNSGADVFVAGSAVFKAPDIPKRINELLREAKAGKGMVI
ncbi:ribulose-phosphate 3-epimerase [Fodinibius sp.]|uniref:ribulose-phosphate 3-epimerase n=1 Tax=Fodinibius sp. TaxID=1872440 RepID=UPI003564F74D